MENRRSPHEGPPLHRGVVARHECPACGGAVAQLHRPGRHRIYCTNACRQRAYRWRRANGVRMCVERDGPADMLCNDRLHARRDPRDPASGLRDRRRRRLTACGVFARRLRSEHRLHNQFVPESPNACATCIGLIGVGPFGSGIPEIVRDHWVGTPPDPHRHAMWPRSRGGSLWSAATDTSSGRGTHVQEARRRRGRAAGFIEYPDAVAGSTCKGVVEGTVELSPIPDVALAISASCTYGQAFDEAADH